MTEPGSEPPLHLGPLNGHAVGRILKEAVRRATVTIRAERAAFEVQAKSVHRIVEPRCARASRRGPGPCYRVRHGGPVLSWRGAHDPLFHASWT